MGAGSMRTMALATALTLAVAACGGGDDASVRRDERPPVSVDGSLGVLRVAPGDPLRIALVLDVSGEDEQLAAVLEAAVRTALEDFGAVQQGFRARIDEVIDVACDRTTAARVGEELAADPQLAAVLGPQCLESMLGLQAPLTAAGHLIVTPRANDASLTAAPGGGPAADRAAGVWRTAPTLLDEARTAAAYAFEELELRRAATFHDGSPESAALVTAFKDRFESLGGTVVVARVVDPAVGSEASPAGSADDAAADAFSVVDELLDAVAEARPDVAFLPLGPPQLLVLADEWDARSALRATVRLTTSRAATPDFLGDPVSEGHLVVAPVLEFPDVISAVTGMSSEQVLERVAAVSGARTPAGWWAYAYDATTLLLRALEDASIIDSDGSLVVSRSELRLTMSGLAFRGLTGDISCDALGDCGPRRFDVRSHTDASAGALTQVPVTWSTMLGG